MAVITTHDLACDVPDCLQGFLSRARTGNDARLAANRQGWQSTRVGDRTFDFCPAHATPRH